MLRVMPTADQAELPEESVEDAAPPAERAAAG
jgi:hypothetical protein